jgi:DNA polymerase-3 subunit gamma/tau
MPAARGTFTPTTARSGAETTAMRVDATPHMQTAAAPHLRLNSFAEIVALAAEKRDITIKKALENDVRLVRVEDGMLEIALEPNASRALVGELSRKLEQWTGRRWTVAVSNAPAQPTLRAQAQAQQNELENAVRADPRIRDVMAKWPGAEVIKVERRQPQQAEFDADMPETTGDDD